MEIERFLLYVMFALAYSVFGYISNILNDPEINFEYQKAGKTLLIGVVVGVIMAYQGSEVTTEEYLAISAIAIPIVDQIWNIASKELK